MIYDCFTFFNELELLKIRLEILSPVVDKFVLVELNKTFTGKDKPYFFQEHKTDFSEYLNKIIWVHPANVPTNNDQTNYVIEFFQRNAIMQGLQDCNADDIIMLSDLDEIPNPQILNNLDNVLVSPNHPYHLDAKVRHFFRDLHHDFSLLSGKTTAMRALQNHALGLSQYMHYYFLNCRSYENWVGTYMVKYCNLYKYGKSVGVLQKLRHRRGGLPQIKNAGWHFSYLGGKEKIREKLTSIIDVNPEIIATMQRAIKDDAYLDECLDSGKDLYGRKGKMFEYRFIHMNEIGLPNIENIVERYPWLYREIM